MESQRSQGEQALSVRLDAESYAELARVAGERGDAAEELVSRWIRERLAHERERALGRAREQRPKDAERGCE